MRTLLVHDSARASATVETGVLTQQFRPPRDSALAVTKRKRKALNRDAKKSIATQTADSVMRCCSTILRVAPKPPYSAIGLLLVPVLINGLT